MTDKDKVTPKPKPSAPAPRRPVSKMAKMAERKAPPKSKGKSEK